MSFRNKLIRGLVAGGLTVALSLGVAFASIGTGTVTADPTLRIRSAPTTSSTTLTTIPYGVEVDVLEDAGNGWYKVEYKGVEGYMSGEYLTITLDGGEDNESVAPPTPSEDPEPSQAPVAGTPTNQAGYVNDGPLNVRSGPGTDYDRIGSLSQGAAVTITEVLDGWYKITSGDTVGYVSAQYITIGELPQEAPAPSETPSEPEAKPETEPEFTEGYVNTSALNVRTGPGTDYDKIGLLHIGDAVTVLSEVDGWYKITSDSLSGYVSKEYISSKPDYSNSEASDLGAQAAALALQQVGKRYIYGGTGPYGFDCSGLVYYVYRTLGYTSMARGASSQYYNDGWFVSKSLAVVQPGDLVFFFDPANDSSGGTLPVTHVGIYVGDNQFVHASTPSSGVKIDTLFGGYYSNRLVAIKRIG